MVVCFRLKAAEMQLISGLIPVYTKIGKIRKAVTSRTLVNSVIKISSESIRNIWFKVRKVLRKTWRQEEKTIKTQDVKSNKNHLCSRQSFRTLAASEHSITFSLQNQGNKLFKATSPELSGQACKAADRNSWKCLKTTLKM